MAAGVVSRKLAAFSTRCQSLSSMQQVKGCIFRPWISWVREGRNASWFSGWRENASTVSAAVRFPYKLQILIRVTNPEMDPMLYLLEASDCELMYSASSASRFTVASTHSTGTVKVRISKAVFFVMFVLVVVVFIIKKSLSPTRCTNTFTKRSSMA